MLQLLMHHVGRTDLTGIANCHVRGLHSIMLHDQDGNRVRLYVTTEGVETNQNYIQSNDQLRRDYGYGDRNIRDCEIQRAAHNASMTLGLHGHRTDIRLVTLCGSMYNVTADVVRDDAIGRMRRYAYTSPILDPGNGGVSLVPRERYRCDNVVQTKMLHGDHIYLEHNKMHTIYVERFASWLVFERGATQETDGSFYSYNANVARQRTTDMYQPMDSTQCQALLARVISGYQQGAVQKQNSVVAEARHESNRIALTTAKQNVAEASLRSPSAYASSGRSSDLRLMQLVTGSPRSSQHIMLLTDDQWAHWCHYIASKGDNEELSQTEFMEWAATCAAQRLRAQEVATSPAVADAIRPRRSTSAIPGVSDGTFGRLFGSSSSASSMSEAVQTFVRVYDDPSSESPSI